MGAIKSDLTKMDSSLAVLTDTVDNLNSKISDLIDLVKIVDELEKTVGDVKDDNLLLKGRVDAVLSIIQ